MITDKFISSDGKTEIIYYIYTIETDKAKGIVQISHGMMDHITRYKDLINFLNANGYIVCGCDDLGHGKTGENTTYGFFADKNGGEKVLLDLHTTSILVKNKYPSLPFYLIGHSMGSFFRKGIC